MRTVTALWLGVALAGGGAVAGDAVAAGASPALHPQLTAQPQLAKAVSGAAKLTGAYQLYCPKTAFGDVVIGVTTVASLSPSQPGAGVKFYVKGVQEKITFPQGLAQGLASLGTLLGTASLVLHAPGATPASMATPVFHFTINLPKKPPAAGLKFSAPAAPAPPMGPFTAGTSKVVVEEDKTQKLTLALDAKGQQPFPMSCTSFPPGTAKTKPGEPWAGAGEPPSSEAIEPVIALG